jgi:methionyl-tRNA synthetase
MTTILPIEGRRNVLITSALPYVNNVPHLGNIIGCVLSADVYARFCRKRDYQTLYVCGTDEYGTSTEMKAVLEDLTPREVCDKYHAIHKEIYEWFDISFDVFGRTSTDIHTEITQDIFHKCNEFIKEKKVNQHFCETCDKYLSGRFVCGTCPKCGDVGKGNQCDGCGAIYEITELKDPKCALDKSTPIVKNSNHLFFCGEPLEDDLKEWMDKRSQEGIWTSNAVSIAKSRLKEGIKDQCITRDLVWGTPVPKDGFRDKVFYVWFDAPIGYLSITAGYTDKWEQWWKNPDVELTQFMAKDNVAFHTNFFVTTLMATGNDYTLLKNISSTEYLNFEQKKFSKSNNIGIFGDDAMKSGIPVEVWRYYLLRIRPETSDSSFQMKNLISLNNNELVNNLGNYIYRALGFLKKKFNKIVPEIKEGTPEFTEIVNTHLTKYIKQMEEIKIKDGIQTVMSLSKFGNQYIQENAPWKMYTSDIKQCKQVMAQCVNLVYILGTMLEPYMPSVSRNIMKQLNVTELILSDTFIPMVTGEIGEPEILFKKIDNVEKVSVL